MEEAVTLFIQGHGSEKLTNSLKNDPNIQLLSFVGMPGIVGEMVICENNNKPIDINIIEFLNVIYNKTYKEDGSLDFQSQLLLFNELPELLKRLYEDCDIEYKDGFSKIWPRFERYFSFFPNPHENCRLCSVPNDWNKEQNLGKNCLPGRCLPERNINNICCPEYGLSIVASSFSNDLPFTLASKNNNTRKEANINISLSTKEYWKSRTPDQKSLVDQIYNKKYIYLSQLIILFKSMGFKYIYLLDPTCRSCKIDTHMAEEYKNLERISPNEEIFTSQPTNIIFSSDEDPIPKTNYFEDCINGICGFGKKKKIDGGKSRKVFKKGKKKTKKVFKKRKTRKIKKKIKYIHNKKNKHGFIIRKATD